jgi:hypothetical protein
MQNMKRDRMIKRDVTYVERFDYIKDDKGKIQEKGTHMS